MSTQGEKRRRGAGAQGRRGMTLIELLVVMGIILVLLSIVVVAVAAATKTAAGANTRALMGSIKQSLIRFKEDIGYYPPVLGVPDPLTGDDRRKLFDPLGPDLTWGTADDILPDGPSGPNPEYKANIQKWFSVTSLAEYLVGYGHHNEDGYGVINPADPTTLWPAETPRQGIRHPGRDGVWGATYNDSADGALAARMAGTNPNVDAGRVYGPYLDLKDDRAIGFLSGAPEGDDATHPLAIGDYWGTGISYYRRLYPSGSLSSSYRSATGTGTGTGTGTVGTLADVFVLRPFTFKAGGIDTDETGTSTNFQDGAIDGIADDSGDTSTSAALRSAEFALFSPGPDRKSNHNLRVDPPDHFNEDNIVELGP